jgi:hypothetical protein
METYAAPRIQIARLESMGAPCDPFSTAWNEASKKNADILCGNKHVAAAQDYSPALNSQYPFCLCTSNFP